MIQAMQSVKTKNEVLDESGAVLLTEGQAGYVVADHTVIVNGVIEGDVEVKIDADGLVYTLDVQHLQAL